MMTENYSFISSKIYLCTKNGGTFIYHLEQGGGSRRSPLQGGHGVPTAPLLRSGPGCGLPAAGRHTLLPLGG